MEEIKELLKKYEKNQAELIGKKNYARKQLDLNYTLGLIHGLKNALKILDV